MVRGISVIIVDDLNLISFVLKPFKSRCMGSPVTSCRSLTHSFTNTYTIITKSVRFRLRVVPHFSSGIVERAKRERAWKSPHAQKGDSPRSLVPEVGHLQILQSPGAGPKKFWRQSRDPKEFLAAYAAREGFDAKSHSTTKQVTQAILQRCPFVLEGLCFRWQPTWRQYKQR